MPAKQTNWVTFSDDEELTEMSDSEEEEDDAPPPLPLPLPTHPPTHPTASTSTSNFRAKSTRPSTQNATLKSRKRGGLKPEMAKLEPARSITYSTASLYDWMDQGLLDLDAEYQRGVVWNDEKQSALLNTLFYNFHMPAIVFAVHQQPDGSETRVCIDGKQRLTSVFRFFDGEISHRDPTTNEKLYYTGPPGAKRKFMSPPMRNNFKNIQIPCSEYRNVTPEQERDIFQRVQLGVVLGPADRLPAINGPYADLVRNLRRRIDTTDGFEAYLEWGKVRGKDFKALAQVVYLMVHGNEPKKAEPSTTRLEAFLNQQGDDVNALQDTAYNVMDIFCRIVQHPVLGKPLESNLSPLEFIMSAYLVYLYRKYFTDTQLSDAIEHLRQSQKNSNHKFNSTNFKQILSFVQKQVPKLKAKLKTGPAGEPVAVKLPFHRVETAGGRVKHGHSEPPASGSKRAAGKRKREEQVESEESEDDGYVAPVKKRAAKQKPETQTRAQETLKPKPSSSRLSLEGRTASTSKAKTSIKKGPPVKRTANVSGQAGSSSSAALTAKANPVNEQVGRPTVRPPLSARTGSISPPAPSVAPGTSFSTSASASTVQVPVAPTPNSAAVATSNVGSTSAPARLPRPGRSRPLAPPIIANPEVLPAVPPASSLVGESVEVTNASTTAVASSSSVNHQDRLAPLREARATIKNRNANLSTSAIGTSLSSSNVVGSAGLARSATTVSTTGEKPKYPKFTKKTIDSTNLAPSPDDNDDRWHADCEYLKNAIGGSPGSARQSTQNQQPSSSAPKRKQGSTPMVSSQVLAPMHRLSVPSSSTEVGTGSGLATPSSTPSPSLGTQVPGSFARLLVPQPAQPQLQPASTVTRDPRLARQNNQNQTQGSAGSNRVAGVPQAWASSATGVQRDTHGPSSRERDESSNDQHSTSYVYTSPSKRARVSAPYPGGTR